MLSLRIKLRRGQVKQISSTTADIGVVVLASTTIPSFIGEFKIQHIIYGVIVAMTFMYISIKFLKYGSN